jgi:hypothetical protein
MSTEQSREMLDLLQELALLKAKKPANRQERRSWEERRKEIRAAMLRLAQDKRKETPAEASAA